MRIDTVIKFHFTFEYWILQANPDGSTSYVKKDDRVGMLVPGGGVGGSMVCTDPLDMPMQVRNIRDRAGKQVYAYPMYVTSSEPQLDPFSTVIGYTHKLRKELPREYSQFIAEVLEQG